MNNFEEQVFNYAQTLTDYVKVHELPMEWFVSPDHLAVKAADSSGFEELVEQFRPISMQISCIEMDGRRLATAHLSGNISVGAFGEVEWLEIMEPRPEKTGKDVVGLEHMEFYYPHFNRIIKVLNDKRLDFTEQSNPGHSWMNLVLNEKGQELKLNDKPLGKTVAEEIENGRAYLL